MDNSIEFLEICQEDSRKVMKIIIYSDSHSNFHLLLQQITIESIPRVN